MEERGRPEVTWMAICKRMPVCAALTNRTVLEAIEQERRITEQVVLSVLWRL
jgi:hypothetical protein